jgi:hypothetical protein
MKIRITRVLRHAVPSLALLALFATPAGAQFWEKKDWRQWSKSECKKMLSDSPWSKTFADEVVVRQDGGIGAGGFPEREDRPKVEYVVQLRSALPVRQAVIRAMQHEIKYDKLSAAEKASYDRQFEQYLNQDFDDRVVVHVNYGSNVQLFQRALDNIWRSISTTGLVVPAHTYLINPKGELVDIARFIPPSPSASEFELLFPKFWKGAPMVTEQDRMFQVQLPGVSFQEQRILIEFDVRKMKYRGTFEY